MHLLDHWPFLPLNGIGSTVRSTFKSKYLRSGTVHVLTHERGTCTVLHSIRYVRRTPKENWNDKYSLMEVIIQASVEFRKY
jgi:hypothetical protein